MNRIKGFMRGIARSLVVMPHEVYRSPSSNLRRNWKTVGGYMYYAIGRQNKDIQLKEKKAE